MTASRRGVPDDEPDQVVDFVHRLAEKNVVLTSPPRYAGERDEDVGSDDGG